LLKEKLPLFALAAASAAITLIAQRAGGAMKEMYHQPFSIRVENATVSYAQYLGKAFWPSRLAPLYPHPGNALQIGQVLAAFALLAAISALVVVAGRRRRYLLVGWLWFLGTLVPMIGLVQVGGQAMADRYAYLPFIGLFIMVCWGLSEWAQQQRLSSAWLAGASAVVLVMLMAVAHRQIDYWSDNASLWSHTLQVTRPNYIAEDNLAAVLIDRGDTEQAMEHFRIAAAIYPADTTSNTQLAMYEQQHGQLAEGIERYNKLLQTTRDPLPRAEMLTNRGYAYGGLKDYAQAAASFREAVDLNPNQARAWMGLGVLAQKAGEVSRAIDDYSHSIKSHPTDVTYVLLARALQESGRDGEAETALQTAKALSKDFEQAQRVAAALVAH
jgi:protein O-mannosyl-transferase